MNAIQMAHAAYATSGTPLKTHRGTEYEAFARATRGLAKYANPDSNFGELAHALHENRSLWTVLAADVAENTNGLPEALRAQIFFLAEFTASHSKKVLAGNADTRVLVDINTAIMRGLRQNEGLI